MNIYCKNCKKHTECMHPKKLVLISDKNAKVKAKCAECLTGRTVFDKINDEYDLEQLIKHFFFTDVFYKRNGNLLRKEQKKTENLNPKIFKTKKGRLIMQQKCADCRSKKSRFVTEQEAKGLLSNLELKHP